MSSTIQEPASSEKKDKRSKREKGDHKSKKRHRETEAQAEEERDNKRSKSEALTDGDASRHASSDPVDGATDGANVDMPKKEKRQRRKKRASEVTTGNEHTDQVGDATAIAGDGAAEQTVQAGLDGNVEANKPSKKHKKRHSQGQDEDPELQAETAADDNDDEATADEEAKRKQRKKENKEKKRREKRAQTHEGDAGVVKDPVALEPSHEPDPARDAMDVDGLTNKPASRGFGKMPDKPYPFFTQKVSQYLPLFPSGMIEPIDGYAEQHLKPLLNHYVPNFKGVLLGYHDVEVGEAPGRGSLTEKSESNDEAVLESIDEYAVCFGWLTAKLDLFKPSRGVWMEGAINMQTEGHLGVVCWGMFNASIEEGRLPKGWRWVSVLGQGLAKDRDTDKTSEEATLTTPKTHDEGGENITQLHTTGYWVDDKDHRVRGTLRFQIKNFEIGVSGDYGYLSIEGTMLDEDAEKKKVADELERLRRWKLKNGTSRREMKRLPDFSMTKFGVDAEDESKRAEIWKGSRPGSETVE